MHPALATPVTPTPTSMAPGSLPPARRDLVVHAGRETLIYDPASGRAHGLSPAASLVFRACDGATPFPLVAARLAAEHGTVDAWELLWLILDVLAARGLVARVPVEIDAEARQEFLRRTAEIAVLLPLVTSVVPARLGKKPFRRHSTRSE